MCPHCRPHELRCLNNRAKGNLEHNGTFSDNCGNKIAVKYLHSNFFVCDLRKIKPNVNEQITHLQGSKYSKQVISGVV